MRSRNDKEKAQRREALLNAAQEVFFDKGFERTSMDDIASKAGFSRALLYVYFKDKKDIYRSLRIRSANILRQRMDEHIDENANGLEQVRQIGEAFYFFYQHDQDHFHCLSVDMSLSSQNKHLREDTKEHPDVINTESNTMQLMIEALQKGIVDGSIDPKKVKDPFQTAMMLRGSLHGVVTLQSAQGSSLLHHKNMKGDALVHYTLDTMFEALGSHH